MFTPFYHGTITKTEANDRLLADGEANGTFLIRDKPGDLPPALYQNLASATGSYVLSVVYQQKVSIGFGKRKKEYRKTGQQVLGCAG